jgi:hypothetical protein
LGKIFLTHFDAASKVIDKYIAEFEEVVKVARLSPNPHVVRDFEDRLHGLHMLRQHIKTRQPFEDYNHMTWLPGNFNILARSVIEAGLVGSPIIESIHDADAFHSGETKKREVERVASEKLQRVQAQEARLKRLAEEQRRQEEEIAERLGISLDRLRFLQGAKQ